MKHFKLKRIFVLSLFFIGISAFILFPSKMIFGAEGESVQYSIRVDVSPNIINIESERRGDIRIFTSLRYSTFAANGHSIFVYFNDSDSVDNIRPTRDSLGNLILKFSLEDLLVIESWLRPNDTNDVDVLISMDNGEEYAGQSEVYLTNKR
jgi:hypothetical protein